MRTTPYLVIFFMFFLLQAASPAAAMDVAHDLEVHLDPENHRLTGTDRITLTGGKANRTVFALSPRAKILNLTVNGEPADFELRKGEVSVALQPLVSKAKMQLTVEYTAVFDDPFPDAPVNMDNPGFGVTAIVGEKGTFILSGAGWYPLFPSPPSQMTLTVVAPKGLVAVTAGRSMGHKTEGGRTVSRWQVDRPAEDLALHAGPYIVTEADAGSIRVATYFLPETQPLSSRYIAAVKRYLKLYGELFGPYPFAKFAVVENFFPTGYGFPSYTLLGGRVLRLPFIIDVSLGHEIAHCWWGNGVRVDYASGNWSEGLTTYVADYLYKEQESSEAAEEVRRQWLRNYATLVGENNDFPLSEFISRNDRATKVVGYDKSAMVFHMIRQLIGEKAFWGALRDIFADRLFQRTSWEDFRLAFERRAGENLCCPLEDFFSQWVERDGAPDIALENVLRKKREEGWQVTGTIVQHQGPDFQLPVTVAVGTGNESLSRIVTLKDRKTHFAVNTPDLPSGVVLDPDSDLFRLLAPEEIPVSINTVKASESVLVLVSDTAGSSGVEAAKMLIRSLGLTSARLGRERDFSPFDGNKNSRIYIGLPSDRSDFPSPSPIVSFSPQGFSIGEQPFDNPTDTFFGIFADPKEKGTVVGILHPVHPQFGPVVARKATHYGKYSFLGFSKGQNHAKGTWPVTESPLMVRWEQSDAPESDP